ncbi:unnamed protein product [Prorocentrum cordatum]|uniref:Uncharacterized protein n=1 Tax=Prorocentrum cordatum TaxID=2364126 RepID=A0ABN9RU85_9DINO|nr:unnamed protein product [Polarella glacialis]
MAPCMEGSTDGCSEGWRRLQPPEGAADGGSCQGRGRVPAHLAAQATRALPLAPRRQRGGPAAEVTSARRSLRSPSRGTRRPGRGRGGATPWSSGGGSSPPARRTVRRLESEAQCLERAEAAARQESRELSLRLRTLRGTAAAAPAADTVAEAARAMHAAGRSACAAEAALEESSAPPDAGTPPRRRRPPGRPAGAPPGRRRRPRAQPKGPRRSRLLTAAWRC